MDKRTVVYISETIRNIYVKPLTQSINFRNQFMQLSRVQSRCELAFKIQLPENRRGDRRRRQATAEDCKKPQII